MKLKYLIKIAGFWVLSLTGLIGPAVRADTLAFNSGGYSTNTPASFTGTKGWQFADANFNEYMAITALGVYDYNGDGLANAHAVGLWSNDGTLLASTTVPAGTAAPLIDGYRYSSITPVLYSTSVFRNAGSFNWQYIIGAAYSANDSDDVVTPLDGGLNGTLYRWKDPAFAFGRAGFGSGLPFPSPYSTSGAPEFPASSPFLEVNFLFQVVPEPSVSLLLAPGLLYLCLRRCHSLLKK